jgi:hypothetical protein
MPAPLLHLTAEVDLDLSDPLAFDLRYPGSVALEQTFGRRVGELEVGGDLETRLEVLTGTVRAGGKMTIRGDVDAATLHARELHLAGGTIRARALSASERIVIGPGDLKVDVILAPHIEIHPETTGRVTIIESYNKRGPTKIKGGFSLAEYEELFGESQAYLDARGVPGLATLVRATTRPAPEPAPAPEFDLVEVEALDLDAIEEIDELEVEAIDGPADPIATIDELEPLTDDRPFDARAAVAAGPLRATPTPPDDDDDEPFVDEDPLVDLDALDALDALDPLDDDPPASFSSGAAGHTVEPADEDDEIIRPTRPLPPRAPTPVPRPRREAPAPSPEAAAWLAEVQRELDRLIGCFDPNAIPVPIRALVEAATEGPQAVEESLIPSWRDTVAQHRAARTPIRPAIAHGFRVLSELVERAP